jgi:cobalt-precorrin-7 (C5)-methyltransferase
MEIIATNQQNSRITIAGCGPGHADYITTAVHSAVAQAEVVVGAKHLLALLTPSMPSTATQIAVGADIQAALDTMESYDTQRIVVLASGDTGLFSLARSVQNRFGQQQCQLIPGISSIQVACARLCIDWNDLRILSAHGREPQFEINELRQWHKIALLAGTSKATHFAADLLDQLGSDYRAIACENLTWETEQIRVLNAEELRTTTLASRTIVLLLTEEFCS